MPHRLAARRRQSTLRALGVLLVFLYRPTALWAQTGGVFTGPQVHAALAGVHFGVDPPGAPQSSPSAQRASLPRDRRWTVEVNGGAVHGGGAVLGSGTVPAAGTSFTTFAGPTSPTVSSWYFGTGASTLSSLLGGEEPPFTVTPLDSALTEPTATRLSGGALGGRVTRRMSQLIDLEFSVDTSGGGESFTASTLSALQSSSQSVQTAWDKLLVPFDPAISPAITSTSQVTNVTTGVGSETFVTGAADFYDRHGRTGVYVALGGGAVLNNGVASGSLVGTLQGNANGFAGTAVDAVTVFGTAVHARTVGLIGMGVTQDFTARSGLRVDMRLYLMANPAETFVTAAPATTGALGIDIYVPGSTGIQFDTSPGKQSTLALPLNHVLTATGSGRVAQIALTVGYFIRF